MARWLRVYDNVGDLHLIQVAQIAHMAELDSVETRQGSRRKKTRISLVNGQSFISDHTLDTLMGEVTGNGGNHHDG